MSGLVDSALSRSRMMLTLIALCVVAGLSAYFSLARQGAPEIDIPKLYVSVIVEGASPSDVERLVLKPLEQELRDLKELKAIDTFASEGHGAALVDFEQGWDKSARLADLRDRVDRAYSEMPESAEQPQIIEISFQEVPVVVVAISGSAPERTRLKAAQALQRELESLSEVMEAELTGARDEILEAVVDPVKMETLGLSAEQILQLVQANNRLIAAGALRQGSTSASVSLPGSFETPEDAANLPVLVRGDRVVRLGEMAELRRSFKDADGFARFSGAPTMALQVKKRAEANIIDAVAKVKQTALATRAAWPPALRDSIQIDFVMDQSVEVVDVVDQLESSVMTAVILVMLVVLATLGLRSALLVGFAVPTSFLMAFALFGALGYSVDNMMMFGLILAVGMLVDGAIVVAELAERRLSEGNPPHVAYAMAARRMFWPIVSSTATTLAAFLPMLFWPGVSGEFMSLLPITLIFVLSASLATALIFLPVIGSVTGQAFASIGNLLGRVRGRAEAEDARAETEIGRPASSPTPPPAPASAPAPAQASARRATPPRGAAQRFSALIRLIIAAPFRAASAVALTVAAVIVSFMAYGTYGKGSQFFVEAEPIRAILYVRALGNFSPEEKDRLVAKVERRVLDIDGVGGVFAFSGGGAIQIFGSQTPQDSIGQLQIELEDWRERFARDRKGAAVMADIRAAIADIPGVRPELRELEDGPGQGKPIQIRISSLDKRALEAATSRIRGSVESKDGVVDVEDTRPLPAMQWRLEVDRTAAGRFGADMSRIGAMVQLATRGVVLDEMTPEDSSEAIDVIARFGPEARTIEGLDTLRIATDQGVAPLSNFVSRKVEPAIGSISRHDGQRSYMVRANVVKDVNVNALIATLEDEFKSMRAENPAALGLVSIEFVGEQEEQAETAAFLVGAMIAALGLIFIILLAQFDSFYNALLVLTAVVMSVGGVLVGHIVMDINFSFIMTGTGIVALAGIVVNNNIVLIDTYQEYSRLMGPLEAIARTAEHRLRPVLLTTLTTMAGLAPMVFAATFDFGAMAVTFGSPSALWWVPLSTAVVFGLGFATILTLVATPAALALRIWAQLWLRRILGGLIGAPLGREEWRARREALWRAPEDETLIDGPDAPPGRRRGLETLAAE